MKLDNSSTLLFSPIFISTFWDIVRVNKMLYHNSEGALMERRTMISMVEEIVKEFPTTPYRDIGKKIGISGHAVRVHVCLLKKQGRLDKK